MQPAQANKVTEEQFRAYLATLAAQGLTVGQCTKYGEIFAASIFEARINKVVAEVMFCPDYGSITIEVKEILFTITEMGNVLKVFVQLHEFAPNYHRSTLTK